MQQVICSPECSDEELAQLKPSLKTLGVESVAINLLFSFLRPEQEQRIAEMLEDRLVCLLLERNPA